MSQLDILNSMPRQVISKPSHFSAYGNNPDFLQLIESLFTSKGLKQIPIDDQSVSKTDYLILVHDPFRDSPTGFLNKIVQSLHQLSNSDVKILLVIQMTNLKPPATSPLQTIIPDLLTARKLDYRTAVVWDVLNPPLNTRVSILDSSIKESLIKLQIDVSKSGNTFVYPLFIDDCLEGLSRSLFLGQTSNQTFSFGGTPISDLELALQLKRALQRSDIDIEVNQSLESSHNLDPQEAIDTTSALLNWLPKCDLDEILVQFEKLCSVTIPAQDQSTQNPIIIKPINKIFRFSRRKKEVPNASLKRKELNWFTRSLLVFLSASFLIFIANLALFLLLFINGVKYTATAYKSLQAGDTSNSQLSLARSRTRLGISQKLYSFISPTISLFNLEAARNINTAYLLVEHANQALFSLNSIYQLGNGFYFDSISGVSVDVREVSASLIGRLDSFQTELTQISLLKKLIETNNILGSIKLTLPENIGSPDVTKLKNQVNSATSLAKLLPLIFPPDRQVNYLVLIQDDNELRPTGGYINTYSLFTFTGNKLENIKTASALQLDNSFAGAVSPPPVLSTLIGDSVWKFSDSNYYPDFPLSAAQTAWFYEKESSIKVDGVIAINLSLVQNYLKHTGSLTLIDGREVNADNIRQLLTNPTQETSQDILTSTALELTSQFRNKQISPSALVRSVLDSGSSSNLLIWLSDPATSSIIAQSSFTSLVRPSICPAQFSSSPCVSDTIYFNEANYSKNKANYYSRRLISDSVTISEQGSVAHKFSVDYTYPQPVPSLTSSEYRSLIRLYIPQGSTISSIALDQQPLPPDTITLSTVSNLTQIEFPLLFLLNQNHRLEIDFTTPDTLNLNSPQTSYALTLLSQPGTTNTSQTVSFYFPEKLVPSLLSVPATINRQNLVFSTIPSSTSTYAASFSTLSSQSD